MWVIMSLSMDTIRLLQPLDGVPELNVIEYYITCEFLKYPDIDQLLSLTRILDQTVKSHQGLTPEQISCIRYLYRDWGYKHLTQPPPHKKISQLFTIDKKEHAPGHFLAAIDYAKRNTKDNQALMHFGLTLLLHSALPESDTKPKISAIEQLLQKTSTAESLQHNPTPSNRIWLLISYNLLVLGYCLWGASHLQYPLL